MLRTDVLTPTQLLVVCVCVSANLLDGFDVLALSFASPAIARAWHLGPSRTGLLLFASMAGITLGALGLSS